MEKIIITIASTGNVPTRKDNPNVPITPEDICKDIYQCYKEGASVAHIHARSPEGKPTTDVSIYQEILEALKGKCDIVTQITTGARGGKTAEERGAPLDLRPEMASLTTGSSNFSNGINSNPPDLVEYLAKKMLANNISPEIECFDVSMISNAEFLAGKGLLRAPLHFNLVMNVPGSIKGTPKNLLHMLELVPKGSTISVMGVGTAHLEMIAMGVALGLNVRVGLEDVLEIEKGSPASNVELVRQAVTLARACRREIATPDEARQMLGLRR
jgi:3-keto-5-aminohexanoate cleavage enzyme